MLKKILLSPSIHKRLPASWQASKMNLYGPDFTKAPWREIILSGIKLRFKSPPQTEMFPNDIWVESKNIYNTQDFTKWDGGETTTIYKNGWVYSDGLFGYGDVGGGTLQMIVQRRDLKKYHLNNLFDPQQIEQLILQDLCQEYEAKNKELKEDTNRETPYNPDKDIWLYPENIASLNRHDTNGINSYFYKVWKPLRNPEYYWTAAITDEHLLMFFYTPGTNAVDHLADDNNFSEAAYNTAKSFAENLHITLSPDAERQRQEAQQLSIPVTFPS
ncbi:MAG: hypothetical protein ACR2PX_20660 [Endozoicomonas sp.]|uniref:hypothetical protein n=1 Tax=Endozoicomonas sp. TaxID=1892382 RepID=UPI003D9B0F03